MLFLPLLGGKQRGLREGGVRDGMKLVFLPRPFKNSKSRGRLEGGMSLVESSNGLFGVPVVFGTRKEKLTSLYLLLILIL